jgi:uncharacterized protein
MPYQRTFTTSRLWIECEGARDGGRLAATTTISPKDESKLIAPVWHTLLIVALLLFLSGAGHRWLTPTLQGNPNGRVLTYSLTLAVEWFLVLLVWWGIRTRHVAIVDLIGGSWPKLKSVLRDLGIACGFLLASNVALGVISYLLKNAPSQAVKQILPRSGIEIVMWILLSLTAGLCEELIFRGYLQRQFAALTKSLAVAIILQGIIFGAAHGYQGWKSMLVIAVYGCFFGLLVRWVRNLRPGMMAHFIQDSVSGIVAGRFMK